MPMSRSTIRLFALLVLAATAGCASGPPRMQLAPELAGIEAWPVVGGRGAGHKLEFGRWQVTAPASFVTQSNSIGGGDPLTLPTGTEVKVESSTRLIEDLVAFEFTLESRAGSNRSASADCHAAFRLANRTVVNSRGSDETELTQPGFPHFNCDFAGTWPGKLSLRPHYTQRDVGTSDFSNHSWRIRTSPWARIGYEFLRDGKVAAAVETFGDGRVWMRPDLSPDEADQLALVATALLYFDSLLELRDN